MHRDDPDAVDRFDRALDVLSDGGSPPTDAWLDATDLRLRTLDTAFAPPEGVLMGIWDELVDEEIAPVPNGVAVNGAVAQTPPRDWRVVVQRLGRRTGFAGGAVVGTGGHAGPPLRGDARPWWSPRGWSVGAVSTVALVFVVLAVGYAAIRMAGLGDADGDGDGGPAAIVVPSPSPDDLIVPPPSECTVEPRPNSFFEQFVTTPTTTEQYATFPVNGSSFAPEDLAAFDVESRNGDVVIFGGVEVDDETIAAITATTRQFVACGNAGDGARTNALVTEESVRRIIGDGGIPANVVAEFTASPTPREPDDWEGIYPIQDARLLDNGHVVAIFPFPRELPNGESAIEHVVLVFVNTGDRWLLDGLAPVSELDVPPAIGERLVPSPEACTVEPITWQEIESVAATQTAGSSSPRQSFAIDPALRLELKPRREAGLLQVTGGDPADPATIADIQEVLNEFVACQNAGGFPRWLALFSEEIIGAIGSLSGEGADFYRAELQATPTTRPREQWIGYYPIAEARTFYSGHVVVIQPADINWLRLPNETIEPDPDDPYLLVSFAQEGDRWVIDGFQIVEARDLLEQPSSFPNATVEATVATTPEFTPTHRSNAHMQVNLRSGPSTDSRIVTTLSIAQPLHYLEEDAPTEDPARDGPRWMKFRTENGDIGWVREIDVEPINAPTPTPIG